MITNKQRDFLQTILDGEFRSRDDPHKNSVYLDRIRKRINRELDNGIWLAQNFPDLLRDEYWEIDELGSIKKTRLKMLMQIIKGMYPDSDPALVKY